MKTNKLLSTICAIAASLGAAVAGTSAAGAAPLHVPGIQTPGTNVVPAGNRGVYRSGVHIYLNGHRGYRDHRRGHRYHDGYWFPPAAFALGAIIGGAIAAPPYYGSRYYGPRYYEPRYYEPRYYDRRVYRAPQGSAHVRWCYNRYRSYRAWDNSFQPYHGPRRQCWSPYS